MTYREFRQQFHIPLNPQQEAAVQRTEGPALLLAVPGSGKTTVLVTRLGVLLYCKGVNARNILTVTYTVAAAADMKRRFASLFGEEYARQLSFRTINGLCASVIQYYARERGAAPFSLADDAQLKGVIRDLLSRTGAEYPTESQVKDARTHITYCKNMMCSEEEIHAHKVEGMDFPAVYFEYQDYLRRSRRMDYDDQMVFAYRIFRRQPEILAHFRRQYQYICVDEAQDTSKIQHAILRLLAMEHRNLFMVGDEDQSIYGFRAAWPQALLEFERTWPGARILLMETNYRSTRTIVERADALIQHNRNRHPKQMWTGNPQGEPIRKIMLADYNRQYNYLLKAARDCRCSTAVLYRQNESALPLIDLLERQGTPYACRQREGLFFSSPVVRDLTDMLEFAFEPQNRDKFLRFYYKLDLKIKRSVLSGLLREQRGEETVFDALLRGGALEPWQAGKVKAMQTHFSKLPRLSSFAALQRLVRYMGYGDYLKEQRMDAAKLDILLALANQTREPGPFLLRLRELRELMETGSEPEGCPFVLSTIHASKGLEYDRVILIDVVDGVFPRVMGTDLSPEERAELEEDRRLFYVGVTRARRTLELLTYEEKFGAPGGYSTLIGELLGEEPAARALPGGPTAEQVAAWEKDYIPGAEVLHKRFGRGLLQSRAGSIAVIAFRECGVKKVDLCACLRSGLIQLACLL